MEREELDEQIQQLQAKAEAFFAVAGKDDIEVYRIEKFEPVRQDPQFLGKFYDGDSYVVIKKNERDYDIHYWHGKDSTVDEQATAAAFTVQLSDKLSRPSRHHLELMMEESQKFLSYFKSGIFYLEGGIESGFKHVEPKTYEDKLYIVKGKRYPRVWPMPLKADSINEGDVFILDLGMKLYFWPGKEANVHEKVKGMEIIFNIKNGERGSHPEVFYPRDSSPEHDQEFWTKLGGKPSTINPPTPDQGVDEGEGEGLNYSLFKVSNESGKLELTEITERPLRKDHLDTNDAFILELPQQIFVWIGKNANLEEKKNGMRIAKDFIDQKNKPKNTRISRLPEFGEDVHFKSFFNGFYPCISKDQGKFKNFDPETANLNLEKIANQQKQASKQLFDMLEDYEMSVYVIENQKPVQLTEIDYGHFFSDEIYIIDLKGKKHRYVVTWMGPKLNPQEMSQTSSYMDMVTNYENSNSITRCRVGKGHEEESLMSLFPNGFINYIGKRVPIDERIASIKQNGGLFRVQAPYGESARAIEQAEVKCSLLNSGDSYFVVAPGGSAAYFWQGEGSNEAEQKYGQKLFQTLASGSDVQLNFKEGEEPEEFWTSLGGKTDYSTVKETGIPFGFEPRLFHCSNAQGYFFVKEIYNFTQDDMLNDDVMILDTYSTVYVWIGNKSNSFEKKGALASAQKFIDNIRDERDKGDIQIDEVEAGKEPPHFTVHFTDWRQDKALKWLQEDTQADMKAAREGTEPEKTEEKKEVKLDYLDPRTNKFDLDTLKTKFPQGVDPTMKEQYLDEKHFSEVFAMTHEQFSQLRKWKQQDLKKSKGLF